MWLSGVKSDGVTCARSRVLGASTIATLIEPPRLDASSFSLCPPHAARTVPAIAHSVVIRPRRPVPFMPVLLPDVVLSERGKPGSRVAEQCREHSQPGGHRLGGVLGAEAPALGL